MDDEPTAPYPALETEKRAVRCLGRRVSLADTGLPASIESFFAPTVDRVLDKAREVLADPIALVVETDAGRTTWEGGEPRFVKKSAGQAVWESTSRSKEGLSLACRGAMEFDGHIDFRARVRAEKAIAAQDIRLEIPMRPEAAVYMIGLGREGGCRPEKWAWRWDLKLANHMVWFGDVNAGLQCKLKGPKDTWDLYNLEDTGLPESWHNSGKGGCAVSEEGGRVVLRAFSGARALAPGEEIEFRFALLITPLKTLDANHWNWRYYHGSEGNTPDEWLAQAKAGGANVMNVHHANGINPFINYPFVNVDQMKAYVERIHSEGMKLKIYYTIRELSNRAAEIWAMRSLGDEIYLDGPGFRLADHFDEAREGPGRTSTGNPWLCEHLITGYVTAWHHHFPDGVWDASIGTTGLSRWHNYYLEGLGWLVRNVGIDGLYLDGIGYDREIMRRVRKVLDRARPGCLIDFHSGNNFHPEYGLGNVVNQYMEHLPYIDSLWFGEGFDYNKPPDYWLVEISGIPFGLFGEMLHGGGNPWRGMLYGMTNRLPWAGNPSEIWKAWDAFGIREAEMIGYWAPDCPVKTGRDDVLATVYRKKGKSLISVASWAAEPATCRLDTNWERLGLDPAKTRITAPPIPGFQDAAEFPAADEIPIEPGRGWLLIFAEEASR